MLIERQSKCSKVAPAAAFLKIHRNYFSLAGGKQEQHKFKHDRCKNERPREIRLNMVKQNFQTKTNRFEELKNVYRLFQFSCPTPTAAAVKQVQWAVVRCCKYLFWMISLGACIPFFMAPAIFSTYFILTYAVNIYTSLSPKFFSKWVMWIAAVTWFNTICSKPFQTAFQSETKTLFLCNFLISLNYECLQLCYHFVRCIRLFFLKSTNEIKLYVC